jgi:hypothetical protein
MAKPETLIRKTLIGISVAGLLLAAYAGAVLTGDAHAYPIVPPTLPPGQCEPFGTDPRCNVDPQKGWGTPTATATGTPTPSPTPPLPRRACIFQCHP